MRTALLGPALLALACAPVTAHALTSSRVGVTVDALGGVAFDTPRPAVGGGWGADVVLWFGKYDDEYSLGRYYGIGVGARQEFTASGTREALELELVRGEDVLVLGGHALVAGGIERVDGRIGETVDVGLLFKARLRFTGRFCGLAVRLEGGPDLLGSTVGAHANLTFGVELASPFKRAPSP